MLIDPHPSQQHAGLGHPVFWLHQEVTRQGLKLATFYFTSNNPTSASLEVQGYSRTFHSQARNWPHDELPKFSSSARSFSFCFCFRSPWKIQIELFRMIKQVLHVSVVVGWQIREFCNFLQCILPLQLHATNASNASFHCNCMRQMQLHASNATHVKCP